MTTRYPSGIDSYGNIRRVRDRLDELVAADHNDVRSAVLAIEQTLGVNPQSVYGTVGDRMAYVEAYGRSSMGPASGDLTGIYPGPTVAKIQGNGITIGSYDDGYALTWDDGTSSWILDKPIPGGTAGGDLSGTFPNPIVSKIEGYSVINTQPTDGYALTWNTSNNQYESKGVLYVTLKSPDNSLFRINVDNSGNLTTTKIS